MVAVKASDERQERMEGMVSAAISTLSECLGIDGLSSTVAFAQTSIAMLCELDAAAGKDWLDALRERVDAPDGTKRAMRAEKKMLAAGDRLHAAFGARCARVLGAVQ